MFTNNKEMLVGAVSTAMIGFGGFALRKIAAKAAPTVGLALAAVAVPAALFVMPQAALADNECGVDDPTINGALADSYDCPDADYPEGVTYAADGDLTVNFTNGGVTTIGENPDNGGDDPEPGDDLTDMGGIDLSATGGDGITFDSATTATQIRSNGVLGALLSVTTVNGDIDIDTGIVDADANTPTGVTHGIFAESTGSGSIDINTTGTVDARSNSNPADSIGIQAITGSGSLTITVSGDVTANEAAIDATAGTGLLTINVATGSGTVGSNIDQFGIRSNADETEINIASGRSVRGDVAAIQATGGSLTLNNDGTISRALDFADLTGGYVFNNNAGAIWDLEFTRGQRGDLGAGELNNAGTIQFRNRGQFVPAHGTTFTGMGDSVLEMRNTLFDGRGQDCTSPTVMSCLDLSGGTTAGQTAILVQVDSNNPDSFAGALTGRVSPGLVLIDVGGGSSQADHFVLHPDSFANVDRDPSFGTDIEEVPLYAEDPVYGAVLETGGLFDYALLYNPNNQQHVLASVPNRQGLEYVAFIDEALSIWHITSDAVAGRQADLRSGSERGGWVRVVRERTERDAAPRMTEHGNTFVYDQGRTLDTTAVMAGVDVASGDNYVIGMHAGVMSATQEFDDSTTRDRIKGVAAGAYAGWWHDSGLTLDGTLNANFIPELDHRVRPGLETSANRNIKSYGVRAEAGWRLPMGESFYIQPLATAAYVSANVASLHLRDYDLNFKDEESTRAALGVRLGGETGRIGYWLTARAWEEYSEDGRVEFATEGDPLAIEDDLSGSFEEVGLGVNLAVDDKLSMFLSGNGKFGDADGHNVTIGARLNW